MTATKEISATRDAIKLEQVAEKPVVEAASCVNSEECAPLM